MKKEAIPLRGPELLYAVNKGIQNDLRKSLSGKILQLPLRELAEAVREGEGYITLSVVPREE